MSWVEKRCAYNNNVGSVNRIYNKLKSCFACRHFHRLLFFIVSLSLLLSTNQLRYIEANESACVLCTTTLIRLLINHFKLELSWTVFVCVCVCVDISVESERRIRVRAQVDTNEVEVENDMSERIMRRLAGEWECTFSSSSFFLMQQGSTLDCHYWSFFITTIIFQRVKFDHQNKTHTHTLRSWQSNEGWQWLWYSIFNYYLRCCCFWRLRRCSHFECLSNSQANR